MIVFWEAPSLTHDSNQQTVIGENAIFEAVMTDLMGYYFFWHVDVLGRRLRIDVES